MSPILGIWASGQQPALNASSFDSIATVTVGSGGSAGPITFSSIPQTYTHLQIRLIAQQNINRAINMRFNSTGGTSYASHYLDGDGASARAGAYTSDSYIRIMGDQGFPTSSQTSIFGGSVIDILDYANTNKNKTVRMLSGYDANGSGAIEFDSGVFLSTNAITQIDLLTGGSTFSQYTKVALFGIK